MDPGGRLATDAVIADALADATLVLDKSAHHRILGVQVKRFPGFTLLAQTSEAPIDLGAEMAPFLDMEALLQFMADAGIERRANSPEAVYVYNWVERAQGPMIFEVGVIVDTDTVIPENERFRLIDYPPMKVASLIYVGPFPHEANSGWDDIRWEERVRDAGYEYTERVYRELYHRYDYPGLEHVTEIQLEVR
jgi:hypothetical protein